VSLCPSYDTHNDEGVTHDVNVTIDVIVNDDDDDDDDDGSNGDGDGDGGGVPTNDCTLNVAVLLCVSKRDPGDNNDDGTDCSGPREPGLGNRGGGGPMTNIFFVVFLWRVAVPRLFCVKRIY